ncbi:MAG: WD40 repeat domain-containing protein [Gaiellales bacterium]
MNEDRLRKLLADQAAPDEVAAAERGWRVASSGFEESPPTAPRRARPLARLATAGAAACILVGAAFTPPGEAVTDWVSDAIRPEPETAVPPLRLPAEGRLLVNTAEGPWIVQQDGSKRLLGRYEDSSWSPGGLFVVASRGRQLTALEPGGRVRWTLDADRPVSSARWAPSGYRIAYLTGRRSGYEVPPPAPGRSGPLQSLRVVAGDGTGDRLLRSRVAEVTPAWRPGLAHVLAYSTSRGEIVVAAVDSGKELWRAGAALPLHQLAWSEDGQRLIALSRRSVRIFDAQGHLLRAFPTRSLEPQSLPTYVRDIAFARRGHRFALIRATRSGAGTEVVTLLAEASPGKPRAVFSAPGAISEIEWSPDGEWLLVAWAGADQWVFVHAPPGREVRTVTGLADRFEAGSGPQLPAVSAWCCAALER